jgi:myo-inositol-1(or 4)-monophosphatase
LQDADGDRIAAETAALLTGAVREAGALALTTFRKSPKQWAKGKSSVVCEADFAVDLFLRQRLAGATPGYGWLSEETEDDPARLAARHVWIVDPIDGTRSYLAGQSDWVVSAALATGGRPVLAALFAPVTDEMFLASAGGGITRNGAPVAANPGGGVAGAKAAGPKRFLEWLAEHDPGLVSMPRIGSLALRLTRVAHGELDVAFAGGNSHDWDLAAADLLVHEAGGALTTLDGRLLAYNRSEPVHGALIAAGRDRHAMLIGLARDRFAELA